MMLEGMSQELVIVYTVAIAIAVGIVVTTMINRKRVSKTEFTISIGAGLTTCALLLSSLFK